MKAKIAKNPSEKATSVDPSLAEDSAFAPPEPAGGDANGTAASAPDDGKVEDGEGSAAENGPRTWWQKLRRKRVLYPLTIGVAAFGIGLGAVVVAENSRSRYLTGHLADLTVGDRDLDERRTRHQRRDL